MDDSESDLDLGSSLANAISNVAAVRESFNPKKRKSRKTRQQRVPGPSRTVARILPYFLPPASKPPRFRGDADLDLIRNHCDAGYGYPQNTGQTSGKPRSVSMSYDMDADEFYQFSVSLFPKLQGKVVSLYKMDKQRRLIKVIPSLPSTVRDNSYSGVTFFKGDEHTEDPGPVVGNPISLQTNTDLTSDSDLEDFNFENWPKVEFLNEAGVDEGGLRREYLEILLRMITSSSLLCEAAKGHEFSKDCIAEAEGHYTAVGRMIAVIILQGGPAPKIFNHHVIRYGINGIEGADIDTVRDNKCREVIEKIVKAPSVSSLNVDDNVLECMEEAGVRLTLNADNADRIVRGLITKNSYLRDHKVALDQFWEGAEELGLRSLLKQYPEKMEGLLCFSCGKATPLTAEKFAELLNVTPYGESGSNSRRISEEVFMNFESFLYDVQDGKCSYGSDKLLQLGDVFQFITGLTSIPPSGLGTLIKVEFTERQCFPTASTCALNIVLPLHLKEYRQLKAILLESVISGPGFGVV